MSSYELLELLEFMPERGAFKTAARGGEYSGEEKVWVQIANEIAVLRASYVPKVKGEEYGSQLHFSPLKIKEMVDKADAQAEVRESFYAFATKPGVAERNTPEVGDDDDGDFGDWR
jgi:hypothetical protein